MRQIMAIVLAVCAGTALAQGEDPKVDGKPLSGLMKQLRSDNRGFQLRAAQSLVKAPAELHAAIVPQVIPVLKSERENDKFVAAQVLGEYGAAAKAAIPDLLPMLEGTEYERNRAAAAKALGQILSAEGRSASGGKDSAASEEVENVTKKLVAIFNDTYPDVRRESVKACGMIGPAAKSCLPHVKDPLEFTLGNTNADSPYRLVRGAAAWTLGRMGPLAAGHVDRLISLMQVEWMCMPEFLEALGKIGATQENVVPNIANRIEKGNWWENREIKEAALTALETFGPKSAPAVPLMDRYLREQTFPAKMTIRILRVLKSIGPGAKSAEPVLKQYAEMAKYREGSAEELAEMKKLAAEALAAVAGNAGKKE